MPVASQVGWDDFESAFASWLDAVGLTARWANQLGSRPALPYATLEILSAGQEEGIDWGIEAEAVDFPGILNAGVAGPRRLSISLHIFTIPSTDPGAAGSSARVLAQNAVSALRLPRIQEDVLAAAGLSFLQQLSDVHVGPDEQLGDRWERRAVVDLEFGYTSLVTDKPGETGTTFIDTIEPPDITIEEPS